MAFVYSLISNFVKDNSSKKEVNVSMNQIIKNINDNETINASSSTSTTRNIVINGNEVSLDIGTDTKLVAQKESNETFLDILKNYDISSTTLNRLNIEVKQDSSFSFWTTILPIILPVVFILILL